jgi:hypothetical protein
VLVVRDGPAEVALVDETVVAAARARFIANTGASGRVAAGREAGQIWDVHGKRRFPALYL